MIGIARAILILSMLSPAGAAPAQDEIFRPSVPPTATSPLIGDWRLVVKGGTICGADAPTSFESDGRGGIRGHVKFRINEGDFTKVEVKGNAVRLRFDWVDALGSAVVSTYSGTLSADKNTVTGDASGEWDDGCTFKMTRR